MNLLNFVAQYPDETNCRVKIKDLYHEQPS
jgi:hypothetical protein